MEEMIKITRKQLGHILSAHMSTRTIKADMLAGTGFEDSELTEDWVVVFVETDEHGVLTIECIPPELYTG